MKKITYMAAGAAMLASLAFAPIMTFAQVQATMPALYNSSGQQVNMNNTTPLMAGYYWLTPGQSSSQVYYYGNGTFYNPMTNTYGGSSVNDPNGVAGVALGYVASVENATTPTAPNTGFGGNSTNTWAILMVSGLVAIAGASYVIVAGRNKEKMIKLG